MDECPVRTDDQNKLQWKAPELQRVGINTVTRDGTPTGDEDGSVGYGGPDGGS